MPSTTGAGSTPSSPSRDPSCRSGGSIWLGVNIGPGFSRQVFGHKNGDYDYTQGFTFLTGPTIDIFITRHLFLGFEADFIFNVHDETCQRSGSESTCYDGRRSTDLAPVHQVIYGFHIGGTFG